jgi:hypothetical protein
MITTQIETTEPSDRRQRIRRVCCRPFAGLTGSAMKIEIGRLLVLSQVFSRGSVTHFWHRDAHKDAYYARQFVNSAARYFTRWGWRLA